MSYGYCPECGKPGHCRERRPNGNDICEGGHTYPSKSAFDTVQLAMKVAAQSRKESQERERVNSELKSLGLMPFVITTLG